MSVAMPQNVEHAHGLDFRVNLTADLRCIEYTGFAFRFEHSKGNRGRNGLHQLGQLVAPSILFPVF